MEALAKYEVENLNEIFSPALLVFEEILDANLNQMIQIAGSPARLRPHCKTHKMPEVIRRERSAGIERHKAATFAECEMLANAGVRDIFLAYNLVGPNQARAVRFQETYPDVQFSVTGDDSKSLADLGRQVAAAGQELDVLLDLDTGQHRTGVSYIRAAELYRFIADTPGLRPGGLHVYDGQNHQSDLAERRRAVLEVWHSSLELVQELERQRIDVPRIVAGGTGSFPIFAELDHPGLELSPGTCIFHDRGYGEMFPDLEFTPAALLLTRVISRPTENRITLDLGYKAVASDPEAAKRVVLPAVPDAKLVLQNEEHLVIETNLASQYSPGDELLAIPRHVCPTSALHKSAYAIRGGRFHALWNVEARDRQLTI